MALARMGHHGNTAGGQPTPPTVLSVQHAGAVAVPKRIAQAYITVHARGGAESMELGGRGGKGGKIKGVQHLWEHPSDGTALQLPG